MKEIDRRIANLKSLQQNFRSFGPNFLFSQYLEYGINDKSSFVFKLSQSKSENYFYKNNHAEELTISTKYAFFKDEKNIFSIEPGLVVFNKHPYQEEMDVLTEIKLNYGRSKQLTKSTRFNSVELVAGANNKTNYYKTNYTNGLRTEGDFIFLLQTFNTIRPKEKKIYKINSIEKISIASEVMQFSP